ncbi:5719_t:CDS:1, partial [Racocetra fulgida]
MGYVHKDLHGGSIEVITNATNATAYISDFNMANKIEQEHEDKEIYGVLPYVAPEVLMGHGYTTASDIYSFGVILSVVSTGIGPFDDRSFNFELVLEI